MFFRKFGKKTDDTVQKHTSNTIFFGRKRRAFRLVFLNTFGKKADDAVKKNRSNTILFGRKRQAFRFVFCNFGQENRGHSTNKTASIPSCFLNIFGKKTDDTVPKNRSEVSSQLKRASMPFCFLHILDEKTGGTVLKRGKHFVLFFKHFG